MKMKERKPVVCICGGGSQGHISTGVIGSNSNYIVNVLTRRPESWSHDFTTIDLTGKEYKAAIHTISDDPAIVAQSDIVLICLPGYAIGEQLQRIKTHLSPHTIVGCVFGGSGFFIQVQNILGDATRCFALQRVPFTGRPLEYGHSARLKGYKPYLKVATMNIEERDSNAIVEMLEDWYNTPVYKLSHYLEATLSNSNPILHPCRLYVLFKDWTPEKVYTRIPFLYDTDWDDESSELWVACDNELRDIIKKYPIDEKEIPSILEYYGCADTKQLTAKIQSIEPFKGVQPHMIEVEGGYKLDTEHRYFIEDIPYGLVLIKTFAEKVRVPTPNIDRVLEWAQRVMGKSYIINNRLIGSDVSNKIKEY